MGTLGWLIFRRLFWGPVSLLVIWPLKLIYSIFSVLITSLLSPILGGKSALSSQILASSSLSGSRTSLRVMPSASGKPPPFPEHMRRPGGVYMPAGAGGAGAKEVPDNQQRRQYSEMIGTMVDEANAIADLTSVVGTGMVAQATQGIRALTMLYVHYDYAWKSSASSIMNALEVGKGYEVLGVEVGGGRWEHQACTHAHILLHASIRWLQTDGIHFASF